jgi:hypothetical protein
MTTIYTLPKVVLEEIEEKDKKVRLKAEAITPLEARFTIEVADEQEAMRLKNYLAIVYNEGVRLGKKEVITAVSHSLKYFVKA